MSPLWPALALGLAAVRPPVSEPLAPAPVVPEAAAPSAASRPEPTEVPAVAYPRPALPPADDAGWLDWPRRLANRALFSGVERLDGFFGDDRMAELERPRTRISLENGLTLEDDGSLHYGFGINSTLRLPRLGRLLRNARLVLANAASEAFLAAPTTEAGIAEARFDLFRSLQLSADTGAGFKFSAVTPAPYVRVRGHIRQPLGDHLLLRATQSFAYQGWDLGPASATEVRLALVGHGPLTAQASIAAAWTRERRGLVLALATRVQWMLEARTSLYGGVRSAAFTDPAPVVDVYTFFAGLRRDLYRGWVFGQVEPALVHRDGEQGPFERVWAVTFRLDLVFDTSPGAQ